MDIKNYKRANYFEKINNSKKKLKPCHHGHKIPQIEFRRDMPRPYFIGCDECEAMWCVNYVTGRTEEEAIALWNDRIRVI